jgi:hypothetical protein
LDKDLSGITISDIYDSLASDNELDDPYFKAEKAKQ